MAGIEGRVRAWAEQRGSGYDYPIVISNEVRKKTFAGCVYVDGYWLCMFAMLGRLFLAMNCYIYNNQ